MLVGATTTLTGLFVLAAGPKPGDAPAHLYRTLLVDHGMLLWDNLWYAGQYPLASYSLLYYFPASLFGNLPLVFAAAVSATVLFAAISHSEWGSAARWPTRAFAVFAAAPMFTGLYSFAVGFTALLATLRLLQLRRPWLVPIVAALTLGLSPLAFAFLFLTLVAIPLRRAPRRGHVLILGGTVLALGAFQLAVLVAFPTPGWYPFNHWDLLAVLTVSSVGAILARKGGSSGLIERLFLLWGLGSIIFFVVPTAVGDNWTRLREFVFPLMLVAAIQARFRPRPVAIFALMAALAYNIVPYLMLIPYRGQSGPQTAAFWKPAIAFLDRDAPRDTRVEVVPTAAHWEAYWIPEAGFALARGWYRQLDEASNPALYRRQLSGADYRVWLHQMAISFVLLPATTLDPVSAPLERRALLSGRAGLREVFHDRLWTIYAVRDRTPLLTGPSPSRLTHVGHQQISGWVARGGSYLLRVHYTPYWTVKPRSLCIKAARTGSDSMTRLLMQKGGYFSLEIPDGLVGDIDAVFDTLTHHHTAACGS